MDQSLPEQQRLKSKKLIEQLFIEGKSLKAFPLKLVYVPFENSEKPELKTAFTVPKKLVKTAVGRNRIKRLMREVFRKNKYLVTKELSSSHAFMFIYISHEAITYEKMEKCMIRLLEKFSEKN